MSVAYDVVSFTPSWWKEKRSADALSGFCALLVEDTSNQRMVDFITLKLRNGQKIIVRPKPMTASDAPTQ